MQPHPSYHLEIQVEVVLKELWSVMSGSFALKYEWLICMKNMKGLRKCGLKRGVVSLVGVGCSFIRCLGKMQYVDKILLLVRPLSVFIIVPKYNFLDLLQGR